MTIQVGERIFFGRRNYTVEDILLLEGLIRYYKVKDIQTGHILYLFYIFEGMD